MIDCATDQPTDGIGGLMKTGTGSAISCTVAWSKSQFVAVPVPVFIRTATQTPPLNLLSGFHSDVCRVALRFRVQLEDRSRWGAAFGDDAAFGGGEHLVEFGGGPIGELTL